MLAKQLDDALCSSSGSGDWRVRGGKCTSCQALGGGSIRSKGSRANGSGGTESQPMSLLAELEQAEAANSHITPPTAHPARQMVDVDLTARRSNDPANFDQPEMDIERWATRLCDVLERQRRSDAGSRSLQELSADTKYRLLKLIGSADDSSTSITNGKLANNVDLAELVRNRDGRVAELTCEVCRTRVIRK